MIFQLTHPQFFTPRKNTPDNSKSYMKPINTHWIKQNVTYEKVCHSCGSRNPFLCYNFSGFPLQFTPAKVGAGMTNVEHFNFNEYKDIESTYKDMLFFVYFSRVSYIFIIQTYIIFISFKN